jgi:putative hydrolase of the HAD superfamily
MSFRFILFDLDETLYTRESGLSKEVGRRIQTWVARFLGVAWEEAYRVRRDYYHRFGTTLEGLIAEHNVDANDYLTFVHDIPVEEYLGPNPALAAMLNALPQRKAVYTNATTEYSWRVLRALGVSDFFERVISIEHVGLRNKLYRDAYEQALAFLDAQGEECIMVEDTVRNLRAAKELGLTTVLIAANGADLDTVTDEESVDFIVKDVLAVERVVQDLNSRRGKDDD